MITPYVTITSYPIFSRNKTGFGYMVYDIANAVGKKEHVEVLCTDSRGKDFIDDGVVYLARTICLFIKNIGCCLSIWELRSFFRQYRMRKVSAIRVLYYWLMTGYLDYLLKRANYDIVHIHGCGFGTELWMQVCKKNHIKYLITLHGLNSFSETVKLESAGKQYERDFLQKAVKEGIPVTVISTGMKHLIEKTYKVQECDNVVVVCNSHSFKGGEGINLNIRDYYGIPNNSKIVLYVGNISENKNQRQMIEVYSVLPEEIKKNTFVLFCGKFDHDNNLLNYIKQEEYGDHLILCGAIDKNEMVNYYLASDAVVLLSYSEGFGLSLIEGMHFGLPCLLFEDMDAFEDIFNKDAVVAVDKRDNNRVAEKLIILLTQLWDKKKIVAYSHKFNSYTMANRYIEVYKKIK